MSDLRAPQGRYCYSSGPDVVSSWEDAGRHGLNCGALAHLLILDLFDIRLPQHLLPLEMYYDREWFDAIPIASPIEAGEWLRGDIAFFGKASTPENIATYRAAFDSHGRIVDWKQHPHLHVTFCTGERVNGQPLFIHATNFRKKLEGRTNDILFWPLSQFLATKTYNCLCGIRRLRGDAADMALR